jgi:hypothetical protein
MPRRKSSDEGGAQAGSGNWREVEKQVALEFSLSASGLGPTIKEVSDGGLKGGGGASLRACRNSLQAARARPLEAPLRMGGRNNRTKRGAAFPPLALGANMGEVARPQGRNYGRDL